MRKILLYRLLAGTMLGLCGCGSAEEDEKTTESHVDSLLTIGGQQKYYKELTPEVINVDVEPLTREDVIDIFSDEVMEAFMFRQFLVRHFPVQKINLKNRYCSLLVRI